MKALLICSFSLLGALSAIADGRFIFNNFQYTFGPSPIRIGVQAAQGQGAIGAYLGSDYTASLYYVLGNGYTQTSFNSANPIHFALADTHFFGETGFPTSNFTGPRAGLFDAGAVTLPEDGTVTVQIRAWYNIGATSYEDALSKGFNVGVSNPIEVSLTSYPFAPQALNTGSPGVNEFTVQVVPEPSVIVIFLLSGITLAATRKK